jgi:8-oxo-dGTP pyrophosphatase MutT (NUDIX family)
MSRQERLLEELRDYQPHDALEGRHHEAILRLVTAGPEAFSRAHFQPGHVTASCYIVASGERRAASGNGKSFDGESIDEGDDYLLLHLHRRLDRWLQMGGHVEAGEAPAEAALREGNEESGLTDLALAHEGIFDLDVHPIPAGKGEPDHLHFDIRYLARTSTPYAIALDANESKELAWVPLARAEALLREEAATRVIHKIRSRV